MTDIAEALSAPALDEVIIRFAGDSGDGMQLTGDRFTSASAMFASTRVRSRLRAIPIKGSGHQHPWASRELV